VLWRVVSDLAANLSERFSRWSLLSVVEEESGGLFDKLLKDHVAEVHFYLSFLEVVA